jgi:hypothetical protein
MSEDNEENSLQKEPYEKPTATKLTREQAKLKLMGHAVMGDEGAKELLERIFQEESAKKNQAGVLDHQAKKDAQDEKKTP